MKTNQIKRVFAIAMLIILCMSAFSTALAASKSYKGINSKSYTITTGRKGATLDISQKAGKVQATVWKNPFKRTTKTVSKSMRGEFDITVSQGFFSNTKSINYPFNSKVRFKLEPNTTYRVTVTYRDFSDELNGAWNPRWKTYPTVKLSANNWAKIK